jgi:hypothetical protein
MLEQCSGMVSAARTLKDFGTPLNTQTGCHTSFETGGLGSDHPFRDSASYVTKTAGTNRPSHSPVTQFTTKCDFGLSKNLSGEKLPTVQSHLTTAHSSSTMSIKHM